MSKNNAPGPGSGVTYLVYRPQIWPKDDEVLQSELDYATQVEKRFEEVVFRDNQPTQFRVVKEVDHDLPLRWDTAGHGGAAQPSLVGPMMGSLHKDVHSKKRQDIALCMKVTYRVSNYGVSRQVQRSETGIKEVPASKLTKHITIEQLQHLMSGNYSTQTPSKWSDSKRYSQSQGKYIPNSATASGSGSVSGKRVPNGSPSRQRASASSSGAAERRSISPSGRKTPANVPKGRSPPRHANQNQEQRGRQQSAQR